MAFNEDRATLVYVFHDMSQADTATNELLKAGISPDSISRIDAYASDDKTPPSRKEAGCPDHGDQHLLEQLRNGGTLVVVRTAADHVNAVERIFGDHKASEITEAIVNATPGIGAAASGATEMVIPVVDEELAVAKRTVDQGSARLYRRVIEIPVEASINLREEHVVVDRAAAAEFVPVREEEIIELTGTAEEIVASKEAYVIEEVRFGKKLSERTEHFHDTVRHTEIELEEIKPEESRTPIFTDR